MSPHPATDLAPIGVSSNSALHVALGELIRSITTARSLSAVTLVVDSPLIGTLLRRQLVANGHLGSGIAGLQLLTVSELVDALAQRAGGAPQQQIAPIVKEATVKSVLAHRPGPFEASRKHPSTALVLGRALDDLQWCALDSSTFDAIPGLESGSTARAVLDFVQDARTSLLETHGVLPAADYVDATTEAIAALADNDDSLADFGGIILVTAVPDAIQRLLSAVARIIPVHRVELDIPAEAPVPDEIIDCPDPATEAAIAVRRAVALLDTGARPDEVAILYPTTQPYAALVAAELDAVGLAWNGPTASTLASTALARAADCLLSMAAERSGHATGITRSLLLRWFAAARTYDGQTVMPVWKWRRLVRDQNLFGDSAGWRPTLRHLVEVANSLNESAQEDAVASAEEQGATAVERRRQQAAEAAEGLAALLDRLETHLGTLAEAKTWAALGAALWGAIEEFHLAPRWRSFDPAERQCHQQMHHFLTDEFPALDALIATLGEGAPRPDVDAAQQMLVRDLDSRRGRHGELSTGIHVGPLTGRGILHFPHVVILGATEGLLPAIARNDPLLPDHVRRGVRGVHASEHNLPTSVERIATEEMDFKAIVSGATSSWVTRPRGAVPGRGTAHRSRFLPGDGATPAPPKVLSSRSALAQEPWAVTALDLAVRSHLNDPSTIPTELSRPVDAAISDQVGAFDHHHGNLVGGSDQPAWDMSAGPMSASGIETFLHCPYHFFVNRVLGISTDTPVDEIDVITPRDLGTLLHEALENLVTTARNEGWLPGDGEPWPEDAGHRLRSMFDARVSEAQDRGLTGWKPSWDATYDRIVATFEPLLDVDATQVRAHPATSPVDAERGFGVDGEPDVPFKLSDGTVVHLRGFIDRVDQSSDGRAVGIVDYKSGKSKYFKEGLGIPKPNGNANKRTKVQDLVYAVAAHHLYPHADDITIRFVFAPDNGEPTVVKADHVNDPTSELEVILRGMRDAGADGRFPPSPDGPRDYCPVCLKLGGRAGSSQRDAAADGPESTGDES